MVNRALIQIHAEEREGIVREPESMEESLVRNCCEESLAKVGNKDGRIKEEPKTASATEGLTGHGVWICRKGGTMGDGRTKLGGHNGQ